MNKVFIWANWSMTYWSTHEGLDTILILAVLQMDGFCVVSERMLISILSVSVDPRDMPWTEDASALAPLCGDLILKDWLSPFLLMCVFRK